MELITITKQEAVEIKRQYPEAHIAILGAGKRAKQKVRYAEESPNVLALLRKLRGKE